MAEVLDNSYYPANVEYNDVDSAQVVSCNTTGLSRLISTLELRFNVLSVGATIIRRGGDPDEPMRGPVNDIIQDADVPSHHSTDAEHIIPGVDVHTKSLKAPTTQMHFHSISLEIETCTTEQEGELPHPARSLDYSRSLLDEGDLACINSIQQRYEELY